MMALSGDFFGAPSRLPACVYGSPSKDPGPNGISLQNASGCSLPHSGANLIEPVPEPTAMQMYVDVQIMLRLHTMFDFRDGDVKAGKSETIGTIDS